MKLKTGLQLSAIFPLVFAIVITVTLRLWVNSGERSEAITMIFLAMTGVLGLVMTAVIVYYTKDILGKIKTLNEWTDKVLKGDLDAAVSFDASDDEVSRLSYSLSKMLREIKGAYSEVSREAAEYKQLSSENKRLVDAAQVGAKQLSDALNRLKETQQEIMQKERLRVYEQVIRGVVHDFGEALTPLQGTIDILRAHPEKLNDKGEMLQHFQTMYEAIHNAGKSLKNLAGIYHVQPERSFGPADFNRIVERTMDLLAPRWKAEASARGIKFDVRSNLQSVPSVAGDESDIQDAVTNVIMNAIEAMPAGGTINISTYADASSVTLEVRDTGKGMKEEVRRRCLEPFYTTKDVSGTGMGLAIVNSVVHRHKGSLKIESDPGRGTRVFINLPVWSEMYKERKTSGKAGLAGNNLSVLLIDDEPLSLRVLENALTVTGHTVGTATNGREGLEKLKAAKFDVVVVDKAMPGMDGIALANEIKGFSRQIPIIMLTGYADIMREEGDIPGNIDFLLSKPVTLDDLSKALAAVAHVSNT